MLPVVQFLKSFNNMYLSSFPVVYGRKVMKLLLLYHSQKWTSQLNHFCAHYLKYVINVYIFLKIRFLCL